MSDVRIESGEVLNYVLGQIDMAPSGVMIHRMDLRWEIEPATGMDWVGWRIRLTFMRPDTMTGQMGRGAGRWEIVERGAWESSVVKTCWLLLELLVRHELMESFTYRGVRIFDPHRTVEQLSRVGVPR